MTLVSDHPVPLCCSSVVRQIKRLRCSSSSNGRIAGSGHGDPEQLEGERSRGRARNRFRLRTEASVDSSGGRRLGDGLGLGKEGVRGANGDRGLDRLIGDSDLVGAVAEGGGSGSHELVAVDGASAGSGSLVVHVLVGGGLGVEVILVDEDASRQHCWSGVSKREQHKCVERIDANFW
jgi:hypothetical protein